ncbi:MAG TPA: HAD family hydrolase [Chloroflexota bacterium]|nr:HAD family hydrolase [Chloroflexota bacterium]
MAPSAVLFDLDDTLIDRSKSLARFAAVLSGAYDHQFAMVDTRALYAIIRSADGGGYQPRERVAEDLARLLPWRNAPTPRQLATFWDTHFPLCSQPTSELVETLTWLRARGLKTGIVTNGRVASQGRKISLLGLDELVDSVVISEAVGIKKPDQRIFAIALGQLNVPPAEAWFVGDHPANDVLGAAAARLTPVWFRRDTTWPDGYPPPRLSITGLHEIIALLSAAMGNDGPTPAAS